MTVAAFKRRQVVLLPFPFSDLSAQKLRPALVLADSGALPPGWSLVPLGELLTAIDSGKSFKCEERPP